MSKYKNRSRKIARDSYWEKHDRESYRCPDCKRTEDEVPGRFEVHHKNGEPLDNRPKNQVGLCRLCHNLREGKKPSIDQIRGLRETQVPQPSTAGQASSGPRSVYLAGSMDDDSAEHDTWRASVMERGDCGHYFDLGSTPVKINSPSEVSTSHGCGIVKDIAGADMELVDESDAVVAYFDKQEQVGTLTELVYAVTEGKPALVLFDSDVVPHDNPSEGVVHHHHSHVYWFLINFLTGDGWNGLDADVAVRSVDSRDEIRQEFQNWDWHKDAFEDTYTSTREEVAVCSDCENTFRGTTEEVDSWRVRGEPFCEKCSKRRRALREMHKRESEVQNQ